MEKTNSADLVTAVIAAAQETNYRQSKFNQENHIASRKNDVHNGEEGEEELDDKDDDVNEDSGDDEDVQQQSISAKRQKLSEDEKLHIRRERNREYSRCTRERKKAQIDLLQQRIEELAGEKARLELLVHGRTGYGVDPFSGQKYLSNMMERIKSEVSGEISEEDDVDANAKLLSKDRSECTAAELEQIRRERNRIHAKKTRLKKRKMCMEMEQIIHDLEKSVRKLRAQRDGSALEALQNAGGLPQIGKFTGFRHGTAISDTGSRRSEEDNREFLNAYAGTSLSNTATAPGNSSSTTEEDITLHNQDSNHAASIAAAAAHVAALTSAAASAGPLINIPPEFKNVPGIQEVVLDFEKKLLMEMQKRLLSHSFKIIAENINN